MSIDNTPREEKHQESVHKVLNSTCAFHINHIFFDTIKRTKICKPALALLYQTENKNIILHSPFCLPFYLCTYENKILHEHDQFVWKIFT